MKNKTNWKLVAKENAEIMKRQLEIADEIELQLAIALNRITLLKQDIKFTMSRLNDGIIPGIKH